MRYVLYNTTTETLGEITQTPFEGTLPANTVELTVHESLPAGGTSGRIFSRTEVIDLEAGTLTKGWAVVASSVKALTPRQLRLWLVSQGIPLSNIEALLTTDSDKVEWEYALDIKRDHPLVAMLGAALGMNDAQIDQAFIDASNL